MPPHAASEQQSLTRLCCVAEFFPYFFFLKTAVLFDKTPLSSPFLAIAMHDVGEHAMGVLSVAGQVVTNPPVKSAAYSDGEESRTSQDRKKQKPQAPILAEN